MHKMFLLIDLQKEKINYYKYPSRNNYIGETQLKQIIHIIINIVNTMVLLVLLE